MERTLNILIRHRYRSILFQECKRFAGHSKWQNIKHTKMEKDGERADAFGILSTKMKIAAREGGNVDPDKNPQLKKMINQAIQANMPASTIKGILKKLSTKKDTHQLIMELRGPGNCSLVILASTNNLPETTNAIKSRARRHREANLIKFIEPSILFDYACYITAKKDCDIDKAMEDALNINALDVEEVKDNENTLFKFKNDFNCAETATTQLEGLGYSIISVNREITPNTTVRLSEEDIDLVNKIKEKLLFVTEIERIVDNIEM